MGLQHTKLERWEDSTPRGSALAGCGGFHAACIANRAEQRRRAAEERERERIAEERANLEKSVKVEQSKVSALRNATARWLRAEQIRSFVLAARNIAVQNGQTVTPGSPFGDWIVWAEQQADRLDPLKESPASIIDRKPEPAPSYAGYYGYGDQKPDPSFRFPKPIWRMK